MKKNFLLNGLILLWVGLFCSCEKGEDLQVLSNQEVELKQQVYSFGSDDDYYVFEMAKVLNKIIVKDPSLLIYLKEEAAKRFDGDFDVLVAKVLDDNEKQANPLSRTFFSQESFNLGNGGSLSSFVEQIKKKLPLLNIYFPCTTELDPESDFLTVFLNPSFNDCKEKIVKAFNKKGEIVELSTEVEPTIPYMVVGINERVSLIPNTVLTRSSSEPVFVNEFNSYYLPDCFNSSKEDSIPFTYVAQRGNRSDSDVISRAKFKSSDAIKRVEKWMRGAPEVYLTVIYADNSPFDIVVGPALHNLQFNLGENNWYTGSRRKKTPCDNFGNWSITNWKNCQKTYMKYHFHEMDNNFTVTVNGWEVKFSGGDLIGDCKVNYSDELGFTYHIGDMFEFDIQ